MLLLWHNTRQPVQNQTDKIKTRTKMPIRKPLGGRKYGEAASKRVESAMQRMKKGTLKSGRSGRTVKSRKQAIAIGLSEARKKGAKIPRQRAVRKNFRQTKRSR